MNRTENETETNRKQNEYRITNTKQQASAVPFKFCYYKDSVMRVAMILWVPLCAQGTFCFEPRGIIFVESTQIRWFSKRSGKGGWSGRAVAQLRPRVSKLWLKRLSNYHSNEIAVEVARREAGAELKGYSHREPTHGEPPGSSPLRSDGSCGGRAGGGSGKAVAQWRPKTLKGRAGKQLQAARGLKLGQKATCYKNTSPLLRRNYSLFLGG
jgi:hypothetical protein